MKDALLFMSDSLEEGESPQESNSYRGRHYLERNHFKLVQPTTVSLMYEHAVYAVLEEKNFLRFLETKA